MKLYVANIRMLEQEACFEEYLNKVNQQRRAKVLRCKNALDQRRSLMAGVLLEHALTEAGFDCKALVFEQTAEGKPYILGHPELYFSISHAGSYAVCLLSTHNVGVDIESVERDLLQAENEQKCLSVASKCFSKGEYDAFLQLPQEARREYFLKLWTRKEAVSKAVGKGLAMDFAMIGEPEEQYYSFWFDEGHYISVYSQAEEIGKEDVELCLMN